MREIKLSNKATQDILKWSNTDLKILKRIFQILDNTANTPFEGIGKPEPLKSKLKGFWSRRISEEHRIVYKVTNDEIIVASLYGHYE